MSRVVFITNLRSLQYYNKWVSLISAILCVVLMFLMDWKYAAGTIGCQALLGAYIFYRWSIL